MDFEEFRKQLKAHLDDVEMKGDTLTASGFNAGAMTMYNYAMVVFMTMQAEQGAN